MRTPDAAAPPPSTLDEIGNAVARAVCEKVDLCCSPMDRARVVGVGENRAECEMVLGSFYKFQYSSLEGSLTSARTVLDASKVEPCMVAYRDAGCAAPGLRSAAACAQVFSGSAEIGMPCQNGFECTSRYCPAAANGQKVCAARKPDGAACTRSGECASGFCRIVFVSGMCAPPALMDTSCGGDGFWMTL